MHAIFKDSPSIPTDHQSPVPATESRQGSFEEGDMHQTEVQDRVVRPYAHDRYQHSPDSGHEQ